MFFKPHVHWVSIGPDVVILDLEGDGYFCWPNGSDSIDATGAIRIPSPSRTEALQAVDLVSATPRPSRDALPGLARSSLIHETGPSPAFRDWVDGLLATREIRRIPVDAGVKAWVAISGTSRRLSRDPQAVRAAASRFWAIMPWLPFEGECLARSSLLVRYLRRKGLAADWIFGVRLWPFMAHCWVQCDDVCLNDDWERLAAYTPILKL